jgi:microcystin degradation protein MlrC
MKVFAGGIATETNTFAPFPTAMADYDVIRPGELETGSTVAGFEQTIRIWNAESAECGWEFAFGLFAFAQPAGVTLRAVYESLRDEFLTALESAMPVDIVLLCLHGAMVADGYDDCETDIIARVRDIVGPAATIGVELDLHCDVTALMIEQTDVIVLFKEYPHTDIGERAFDLFRIIADCAKGKVRPVMAMFDCRMIGMYLTPFEPMRSFVDDMTAMEGQNGVLSLSVVHCFPWGDVPTTGTQILAVTDNDHELANRIAEELGRKFFDLRHELQVDSLDMHSALDKALSSPDGPVVVADQADNAGGGAPSDSTFVLRELIHRKAGNAALGMIWDPIAVQTAIAAGEGATFDLRLGGKMGPMSGDPLDLSVTVTAIVPDMIQEWPQGNAPPMQCPVGNAVALHCQGIDIVVNSRRSQVFSPQVFSKCGIDPMQRQLLVVKSTQHFYAGFAPIAARIIYMSAPGAIPLHFTEIPYTRVDIRKFPWVDNPFE